MEPVVNRGLVHGVTHGLPHGKCYGEYLWVAHWLLMTVSWCTAGAQLECAEPFTAYIMLRTGPVLLGRGNRDASYKELRIKPIVLDITHDDLCGHTCVEAALIVMEQLPLIFRRAKKTMIDWDMCPWTSEVTKLATYRQPHCTPHEDILR